MTSDHQDPGRVWKPPSPAASEAACAFAKELMIDRLIKVPREKVWAAWIDASQLAQWWGPYRFTNPICEIEPTVGGLLHIVMQGPDGVDYVNKGVIRSIDPPAHLEFTVALKEPDGSDRLENLTTLHSKRSKAALDCACMSASLRKRPLLMKTSRVWKPAGTKASIGWCLRLARTAE